MLLNSFLRLTTCLYYRLVRKDIAAILQEANTTVNTDQSNKVKQVALLYSTLTGPVFLNN